VALAASKALGDGALAVIGDSPSLARSELSEAENLSRQFGFALRSVATHELDKAEYRANPVNRCYHCKGELYGVLAQTARAERWQAILDGYNLDDEKDWRPSRGAAAENDVKSPLAACGMNKERVRALARHWGLPNFDKPAAPCLSSRFPYGTAIDGEKLAQVEKAEAFLKSLGLRELRVRHHGDLARIEVPPADFAKLCEVASEIAETFKGIGYRQVALDLMGFRSGSLNEGMITK
jgi:uncharacterized protein